MSERPRGDGEETSCRRERRNVGKMDKGDVPRDDALILHGCLSVTMETVCVYVCALVTNSELEGVRVFHKEGWGGVMCRCKAGRPPTVSASIPWKLNMRVCVFACMCACVCVVQAKRIRGARSLIF